MPYGQEDNTDVFTGPFIKALRIHQYIQDQSFQKEQREMLREKMRLDLDNEKRRRTQEDFNTALTLSSMGATDLKPGVIGDVQAVFGGGSAPITTPTGGRVSMPSPEKQAARQGTLKGIQSRAAEEAYDPTETINLPAEMGGGTADVPRTKKAETMIKIYESRYKANPNIHIGETTDDKGNVTVYAYDKQQKKLINQTVLKGAGKTKTEKAGEQPIPDFDARVKGLMDKWRPDYYNGLGITPEIAKAAKTTGVEGIFGGGNSAATRVRQAEETLYKRAVDSLKNESKGTATATGTTVAAPRKWTIKRSDVPKAAKLKGMSVGDFMRAAAQNGGQVIP